MPTVIAPAEKLPLAVRKNWRDGFESKKADFEKQFSDLLGAPWKIEINPNAIWVYAQDDSWGKNSPGDCIAEYIDSAFRKMKYILNDRGHGQEGKDEINKVCSKHVITMEFDESGKIRYSACDVHDGNLRILFQEECLGSNIDYAFENLEAALNAATPDAVLSYSARHSIKQEWDTKLPELKAKIAKQLADRTVELDPNWEAVFAALKASPTVTENHGDWERKLGDFMLSYFESLAYHMAYQKFESDDMLREGFEEAVSKNKVTFRIVEKLTGDAYYNQLVVEDGVLYLQTVPESWGVNIDQIASKIVDVL